MAKTMRRKADARKVVKAVAKFDCGAEVRQIKKLHADIEKSTRGTLKPAIEIGQKLLAIKENLKTQNRELGKPKQKWMPWCKDHLNMAHRTVTSYISVYRAYKEGKMKGVTSLIVTYQLQSEQTKRTRKAKPKYDVKQVPQDEADGWLRSLTQIGGTLEIKSKTGAQALLALKQGIKQHQGVMEKGKRLVVVFDIGPDGKNADDAATKATTIPMPEDVNDSAAA